VRASTRAEQLTVERMRQREISVTVVIPALNEADGLALILPTIPSLVSELIVVDGGSTDDTVQIIRRMYPSAVRIRQTGRGKGDALKAGLAAATGDIVVTMDADGSMNPDDIVPAVGALLDGCDFVKGSRALDGAGSGDFSPLHRFGNWALTALSNLVFDAGYTDITYGFNAYWRRVMLNADTLSDGFEFEIQAAIRASRSGLMTGEVPCYEAPRAGGASKLSPMRDGWAIARILAVEALPRSVTGFRAVADFYLAPTTRGASTRVRPALEALPEHTSRR
jgi:glycosyltransferase involved in cell wall biosynthesis